MGFDRKYGRVTTEHGDIPDDEPVVVFRARDKHLPDVLSYYAEMCSGDSPDRHSALVEGTFNAVDGWQKAHPEKVRTPDSERSRDWMTEQ